MSNTAEELKKNLIDFASQGGDQRTQGTAEILIDDLLQAYTQKRLTTVKEEVEQIKEKCLGLSFDERDDMEGVISETDVKLCFNKVQTLIEEELQ